jgi:hypothetical protein
MKEHTSSTKHTSGFLPRRVEVLGVLSSRYTPHGGAERPQSWEGRIGGIDTVQVGGDETIRLVSSPMQSVPKPGWVLMLTSGDATTGYEWTLYGMSRHQ